MIQRTEPQRYTYDPKKCPWTATWNVIGAKWKGILWWRLSNGVGRFGELTRAIPQISKKMLTQQLREMERDGIVQRRVVNDGSAEYGDNKTPAVEYSLTEYGLSLGPAIEAICKWGGEHLQRQAAVLGSGKISDGALVPG